MLPICAYVSIPSANPLTTVYPLLLNFLAKFNATNFPYSVLLLLPIIEIFLFFNNSIFPIAYKILGGFFIFFNSFG